MSGNGINKGLEASVKAEMENFIERNIGVEKEEWDKISGVLNVLGTAEVAYVKELHQTWDEGKANRQAIERIDRGLDEVYDLLVSDTRVNHPIITNYEQEDLVRVELRNQLQKRYAEDKKVLKNVIYKGSNIITLGQAYLDHIEDVERYLPPNVFTDYLLDGDVEEFYIRVGFCYDSLGYTRKRGEEYFRLMYLLQKDPRRDSYPMGETSFDNHNEIHTLIKGYMFNNQILKRQIGTIVQLLESRTTTADYYTILNMRDAERIPETSEKDYAKMQLGCYAYKYNRYGEKRQPTKALGETIKMVIRVNMRQGNVSTAQVNDLYKRITQDLLTKGVAIVTVKGKTVLIGKILVIFEGQGNSLKVVYKENHSKIKERDLIRIFGF